MILSSPSLSNEEYMALHGELAPDRVEALLRDDRCRDELLQSIYYQLNDINQGVDILLLRKVVREEINSIKKQIREVVDV